MTANPKNQSFSRIDTFVNKCERCHAWEALTPWKSSPAIERGSHVHAALESLGKMLLKPDCTSREALATILPNPPVGPLKEANLKSYLVRGAEVLEHLSPIAVEEWFEKSEKYPRLVGKIDLVSAVTPITDSQGYITGSKSGLCVIDYKTTTSKAYAKSEEAARDSLQLQIYALIKGIRNCGFVYFLPEGPPFGVFVEFTDSELKVADVFLRDIMSVIEERWASAAYPKGPGDSLRITNVPEHLQVHTKDFLYDLSVFAPGPETRPFINSKSSQHRERCLGITDDKS